MSIDDHPLAKTIAEIWAETLGVEHVGWRDSFFDLGGTSVGMGQIHARLEPFLPRPVSLVDMFFTCPDIESFVVFIDAESAATSVSSKGAQRTEKLAARRQQRREGLA